MGKVIFHPEARDELRFAVAFYEDSRTGLGKEFLAAVESAVAFIRLHPDIGRVIRSPYRRLLVHRFPYAIIYRESGPVIFISAVMHLKRKPGYWMKRSQGDG